MAVTRSKSLKQGGTDVTDTKDEAPQTKPKVAKKIVGKPKNRTTSANDATKTAKSGKDQAIVQQKDQSVDVQLPIDMVVIPTDIVYALNSLTMQHFVVNDCVKEETDTSVDNTLSQSSDHLVNSQRDGTVDSIKFPDSTALKEEPVEMTSSTDEINFRPVMDLNGSEIPTVDPCSHSSLSPMNVDSLTVIKEESPCHLEPGEGEEMCPKSPPSTGSSTSTVPMSFEAVLTSDTHTPVATIISSPAEPLIDKNCELGPINTLDHLSPISDVTLPSPLNPSINSSHVFETTFSASEREFSSTEPFGSSNCSRNIDGYAELRFSTSSPRVDTGQMEIHPMDPKDCPSGTIIEEEPKDESLEPTRTIIESELEDVCPSRFIVERDSSYECPNPTRTIVKNELEDVCPSPVIIESESKYECPSPARTIIKGELEDEQPSPTRTIIKCELEDEQPSPTRTIVKIESEDECPSPARTIIKNSGSGPTSPTSTNAENEVLGIELLDKFFQEHRQLRQSSRAATDIVHDDRVAASLHSQFQTDQSTRRSYLEKSVDRTKKPTFQQRRSVDHRHRKSLTRRQQTSDERWLDHPSSSRAFSDSNRRLHYESEYDGNFRKGTCERVGVSESNRERYLETSPQRLKLERYSNKFSSSIGNKRNGNQWSHIRCPVTPEKTQIEIDTTDDSEPDYGWEDPPPPKRICIEPKSTRDVDPYVHEKMQMFMGKLNSEFDLDVIEESRKELYDAIEESINVQSKKKLVELDQQIQKKKDDYVLNLFGTGNFGNWDNDPALSNVKSARNLKSLKSSDGSADASLLDKMTMRHWDNER